MNFIIQIGSRYGNSNFNSISEPIVYLLFFAIVMSYFFIRKKSKEN
jgi:hypothetical protein